MRNHRIFGEVQVVHQLSVVVGNFGWFFIREQVVEWHVR